MVNLICRRLYYCCDKPLCLPRIISIKPRAARVFVSILSTLMAAFFSLVVIFFTGFEVQQSRVKHLPSTNHFYKTSNVCALILPPLYEEMFYNESKLVSNFTFNNVTNHSATEGVLKQYRPKSESQLLPPLVAKTFASPNGFTKNNDTIIAHCGDCGSCSNPHDIAIYAATRNTLLETTKGCAKHGIVGGRRAANKCMVTKVGLTPGCNDCWVDNIMCDLRECLFSCLWHNSVNKMLRRDKDAKNHTKALDACTMCDEKRCGPEFIKCAGANRRRSGILSDLSRQNSQVCELPIPAWWQSPTLQAYYAATQPAPSPGVHQWSFLPG